MISLLEVAERAHVTGPKMDEQQRDLAMFRKMQELVKRHKLEYKGPTDVMEVSDEYADRAFRAAVDFLVEVGVYCVDTGRSIMFSEQEVLRGAREAPREVCIGEGKDRRVVYGRDYEDSRPPLIRGDGHRPYPEDAGERMMRCFAQIPRTDIVEGFNFTTVEGREIRGLPAEVYATRREASIMREAVRSAGRAGLSITLYPISTRPA
ncbi:MAG: monomethylamine:corrinoid methyltransferase, partial [Candidatus Bathyarchaeia archaeon]